MSDRIDPMLRAAGERLRVESQSISESIDHRAEAGRARESKLQTALARFLPRRYALGTGFVLGANGEISAQQDLLVYDAERYPNFVEEHAALLVPESIYAAISVRTVLKPADLDAHLEAEHSLREMLSRALPQGPNPLYVLFAYRFEGNWQKVLDRYGEHVFATTTGSRLDMLATLSGGGICFDASRFTGGATATDLPAAVLDRVHVFGMHFHASNVDPVTESFADFYKLLLRGLTRIELTHLPTYTVAPSNRELRGRPVPNIAKSTPRLAGALRAEFSGKSVDVELTRGKTAQFAMVFYNAGTDPWVRGTPTEARLALADADEDARNDSRRWASEWFSNDFYATQSNDVIPPEHNGFFIFNVKVPADAPAGPKRFHCRLATASGEPLMPESYANTAFVYDDEVFAARRLTIDPGAVTLRIGQTQRFVITDNPVGARIDWSVTGGCGAITVDGLFAATAATGDQPCAVVAVAGDRVGAAEIRVVAR